MDPFTHLLSGCLVARPIKERKYPTILLLLCLFSAVAPDLDIFVSLLGPEPFFLYHRGITHSIFGALVSSIILTYIFWFRKKTFLFSTGFILSFAMSLIHIYLDLCTSYGTQIFTPVTMHRYALDSVFIIDPFMTFTVLLFFALTLFLKKHVYKISIIGICFLLFYPLFNLSVNQYLTFKLKKTLTREQIPFQKVNILPELFAPVYWKAIITNPSTFEIGLVDIFKPMKPLQFQSYPRAITPLVKAAAEQSSIFRTYLWFAAYPVVESKSLSEDFHISITDLRFYSQLFVNRRTPFTLSAYFNNDRKLIRWEYERSLNEKVIHYLE